MNIKRFDKQLPLPKYETEIAAGMDLCIRSCQRDFDSEESESINIEPNHTAVLNLNIAAEAPTGHFLALLPRSSTYKKKGIKLGNSMGVIDGDYAGNTDEIMAVVHNTSNETTSVERGEKLFQLLSIPCTQVCIQEVDDMNNADRGGFGSTG